MKAIKRIGSGVVASLALLAAGMVHGPVAHAQTTAYSDAARIDRIVVEGNQRIETQSIKSYVPVREGQTATAADIDVALKNLYATGFFSDVKVARQGDVLRIQVTENYVINEVAFEGNKRVEDKSISPEVRLKPRSTYTKTAVQADVKRILDVYRKSGRYSARVTPKIIKLEQNRVNLVFEIDEGPVTKIEKIVFVGNMAYSDSTLRDVVSSHENRWYRFFASDDIYDADRLEYDQELLRRYYMERGYADFQVNSAIAEISQDRSGFFLTFSIVEGPVYKIGKADVASSLPSVKTDSLKGLVQSRSGSKFNNREIEQSVDGLTKALGDMGYAFVAVDPQLARNPSSKTIDVTYQIKEGPRVYVERINVEGNSRTLDKVIRREFRVSEGDPYNSSKLQRSEQRIRNLGYFDDVKVTTEQGSAPDRTNVNVDVTEKSTGELTFGAGYSTVDGALADVGLRESNLMGRGQDLKLKFMIAARRQDYDIGFTEPYFLDREIAAGFDLFKTTQDLRRESSFDRDSNGGDLRMSYPLTERFSHSLKYTLREDEISNVDANASRFIKEQEGTNVTSSIGHDLIWEDRNNKFNPTEGTYLKIGQEYAGLGGDSNYLRHDIRAGYYYPISKDWTFKLTGKAGHVFGVGDDDVRIQDRYFIGGRDIRGFRPSGIGPRDVTTKDALGGNSFYASTAELTFPLGFAKEFGFLGAVFFDAASLWNTDADGPEVRDENSVRLSTGVGLGWASPVGPIRIDFGFPLQKEDYDRTENFRLDFGTRF